MSERRLVLQEIWDEMHADSFMPGLVAVYQLIENKLLLTIKDESPSEAHLIAQVAMGLDTATDCPRGTL